MEAFVSLNRIGVWAFCAAIGYAANPVYVGSTHGLYRSTNAGGLWTRVDIPFNSPLLSGVPIINAVAIDPHDPGKIYCIASATARAFFATQDGGRTWATIPFVGMTPRDVAVDFAGQVIYITASFPPNTGEYFLYKSTNSGVSWTRLTVPSTLTPPNPSGASISKFAADLSVSGTVWVVSNLAQFYKSTDFGQTWNRVSTGITLASGSVVGQTSILGVNQDPRNSQVWYHATDHTNFQQTCPLTNGGLCGLFKSTNGGATFTGLSIPSSYVSSVAVSAAPGTVFAAAEVTGLGGAVLKTTDGGDTWTPLKTGLFTSRSGRVWADPWDASILYVNDSASRNAFYVSPDAGVTYTKTTLPQGPPGCVPGNCSIPDVNDVAVAPSLTPVITSVVNAASLQPGIAANTWVTIFGSNLAPTATDWTNSIVNGNLPTVVSGVSVSIGGRQAYVYFISPGQINVLTADIAAGPAAVTVTTPVGTSPPFSVTAADASPAFFMWPGNQPVATRQDFSVAVKPATFPGATTVAARPGEVVILWAAGFGATIPAAPLGVATPGDRAYVTPLPVVTINDVPATVFGAALAPGAAGLYQIAIQVPGSLADGDWVIRAMISGVQSPAGVLLTVHR